MAVNYFTVNALRSLLNQLGVDKINYSLITKQGYSFFNHLSWYFTNKPSFTGLIGGDRFVDDIMNSISDDTEIGIKIKLFIEETDTLYRKMIEEYDIGNQLKLVMIKK